MRFSVAITLSLQFLLCQRVSSSGNSFFKNQNLFVDEVGDGLRKFLTEYNKMRLDQNELRQVTIIGGSTEELQQVQSLIDSYPRIICTEPEKCVHPEVFNSGSYFIVFLNDLGAKTPEKILKILSGSTRSECRFLFVFRGTIIKTTDISSLILRFIKQEIIRTELVHLDKDGIRLYRPFIEDNCTVGARSEVAWRPGSNFSKINFPRIKIRDMRGCRVSVGTFEYQPKMVIKKRKDGLSSIVGGLDGMLVLLIAQKLNFTIGLKYPSTFKEHDKSRKAAVLREAIAGVTAFGVSRVRPTNISGISISFDEECITWAVPRLNTNNKNFIYAEFPWKVWALIGAVFVVSCMIIYANHTIGLSRNADQEFVAIIIDLVSINLGVPVIHVPVSLGGKLMFIALLCYAIITTTAYKTSLASILTTVKTASPITDSRGIIEANLDVGGTLYHFNVLKDQANRSDEVTSELIKRYKVYRNDSEGMQRVKFGKDFALLARRSTLNYEKQITVKARKLISFDILDECVLAYPVVMIFKKGSYLLLPINKVISRVTESGILQYWDIDHLGDKILERRNADRFSSAYKGEKFKIIFTFYIGFIAVCLLVFFVELITGKFKPKNTGQRILRFMYK